MICRLTRSLDADGDAWFAISSTPIARKPRLQNRTSEPCVAWWAFPSDQSFNLPARHSYADAYTSRHFCVVHAIERVKWLWTLLSLSPFLYPFSKKGLFQSCCDQSTYHCNLLICEHDGWHPARRQQHAQYVALGSNTLRRPDTWRVMRVLSQALFSLKKYKFF